MPFASGRSPTRPACWRPRRCSSLTCRVSCQGSCSDGSSKQGKARRANGRLELAEDVPVVAVLLAEEALRSRPLELAAVDESPGGPCRPAPRGRSRSRRSRRRRRRLRDRRLLAAGLERRRLDLERRRALSQRKVVGSRSSRSIPTLPSKVSCSGRIVRSTVIRSGRATSGRRSSGGCGSAASSERGRSEGERAGRQPGVFSRQIPPGGSAAGSRRPEIRSQAAEVSPGREAERLREELAQRDHLAFALQVEEHDRHFAGSQNSVIVSRQTPQGAEGGEVDVTTPTARNRRCPAETAAAKAERSAQSVTPKLRFSTLAPAKISPSSVSTAAPTAKPAVRAVRVAPGRERGGEEGLPVHDIEPSIEPAVPMLSARRARDSPAAPAVTGHS